MTWYTMSKQSGSAWCGVGPHLLERHDNELRVREVRADHAADVLRVAQVQRGVHLVVAAQVEFQSRSRKQSIDRTWFQALNGT